VFYQFERPPVFFNQTAWNLEAKHDPGERLHSLNQQFAAIHTEKEQLIHKWLDARHAGDRKAEAEAHAQAQAALDRSEAVRDDVKTALLAADPRAKTNDSELRVHHLHTGLPATRCNRVAGRSLLCRRAVVESCRTQCAGLNHHHRFLPAHR